MLDKIYAMVTASYSAKESRGVFLSSLNKQWNIIHSQWVVVTDKSLKKTIETLYHAFVQPNITNLWHVVVDVVTSLHQENDMNEILHTSLTEHGVFVSDVQKEKSAVVLPHTAWIESMSQALQLVQSKYGVGGNVLIYVFTTERFLCSNA